MPAIKHFLLDVLTGIAWLAAVLLALVSLDAESLALLTAPGRLRYVGVVIVGVTQFGAAVAAWQRGTARLAAEILSEVVERYGEELL